MVFYISSSLDMVFANPDESHKKLYSVNETFSPLGDKLDIIV